MFTKGRGREKRIDHEGIWPLVNLPPKKAHLPIDLLVNNRNLTVKVLDRGCFQRFALESAEAKIEYLVINHSIDPITSILVLIFNIANYGPWI